MNTKKGRGYIGQSMSVNAKLAHIRGIKPICKGQYFWLIKEIF